MSEFLSGGYYLGRVERPGLPGLAASASGCVSAFFPDTWCIEWTGDTPGQRLAKAAGFGIAPDALGAATAWASEAFSREFGWPNVFYTLDRAKAARQRFLRQSKDTVLFGLGLHRSMLDAAGMADTSGAFECLQRQQRLARGGRAAGFELLSTHLGMLTCSWLCNGLEKLCAERLGVARNPGGLVDRFEDAVRCAELIGLPETGAEPGVWQPWLIMVY